MNSHILDAEVQFFYDITGEDFGKIRESAVNEFCQKRSSFLVVPSGIPVVVVVIGRSIHPTMQAAHKNNTNERNADHTTN